MSMLPESFLSSRLDRANSDKRTVEVRFPYGVDNNELGSGISATLKETCCKRYS